VSSLIFRSEDHSYWRGDERVPSVTQIIDDVGLIDTTWFTPESRERGTAVHVGCQLLNERSLSWESVDPRIEPYIRAYDRFLLEIDWVPESWEKIVDGGTYAGTYDLIMERPDGSRILIDIKSGCMPKWAGMQTAAYALPHALAQRGCLVLSKNGTYKLHMLNDFKDVLDWQAAHNFYLLKKRLTA